MSKDNNEKRINLYNRNAHLFSERELWVSEKKTEKSNKDCLKTSLSITSHNYPIWQSMICQGFFFHKSSAQLYDYYYYIIIIIFIIWKQWNVAFLETAIFILEIHLILKQMVSGDVYNKVYVEKLDYTRWSRFPFEPVCIHETFALKDENKNCMT